MQDKKILSTIAHFVSKADDIAANREEMDAGDFDAAMTALLIRLWQSACDYRASLPCSCPNCDDITAVSGPNGNE